jgi:hypothetical protein
MLLASSGLQLLTSEMARTRDPRGLAMLRDACQAGQVSTLTCDLSLRRIAAIPAAKGGLVSGITAGDCLELAAAVRSIEGKTRSTGMYFYQLLRTAGVLPPEAPASVRMFTTRGLHRRRAGTAPGGHGQRGQRPDLGRGTGGRPTAAVVT